MHMRLTGRASAPSFGISISGRQRPSNPVPAVSATPRYAEGTHSKDRSPAPVRSCAPVSTLARPETPSPAVCEIPAASLYSLVSFRRDNPMEFLPPFAGYGLLTGCLQTEDKSSSQKIQVL